jgi:hypothetical protein
MSQCLEKRREKGHVAGAPMFWKRGESKDMADAPSAFSEAENSMCCGVGRKGDGRRVYICAAQERRGLT